MVTPSSLGDMLIPKKTTSTEGISELLDTSLRKQFYYVDQFYPILSTTKGQMTTTRFRKRMKQIKPSSLFDLFFLILFIS